MPGFRSETSIPSHAVWDWWCHGELSYVESSDHIPLTSTKDPTRTRVRSLRLCVIYLMILLLYGMDPRGVRKQVCSKSPLSAPFPSVCPLLGFMVENVQNQGLRAWVQAWGGKARDDISSSSEGCRTCVCVHVCVHALPMLHHKLGVCSQQSLYEEPAALKQLCRQSAWPARPALEMRYGGQPIGCCCTGTSLTCGPFPLPNPFPITGPLMQVLVASVTGPSLSGEFLQRVSGDWRTCLGCSTLPSAPSPVRRTLGRTQRILAE